MKIQFSVVLIIAAFSSPSWSSSTFERFIQLCKDRENPKLVKELTRNELNLMSFRNHGGIANGGVCWWHSRFQRNALYLTFYNPDAAIPDILEAKNIIRNIRNGNSIVEIPGFDNFQDFTIYFEMLIQEELEKWQRFEGIRGAWIRGLKGSTKVSSEWMQKLMDDLYEEVEGKNRIGYQKLQMNGPTAHAWLVINMKKTHEGYDLEVLDSNFPYRTSVYRYEYGDTFLDYPNGEVFTPYLEFTEEMDRIEKVIKDNCAS